MNEGEAGPQWVDAGGRPITVPGSRSTFRDWAGETTTFPLEVAEPALAHTICDKPQAACELGDKLAKRRKMMEAWARYCAPTSAKGVAKVVTMAGAQA
jgi:hypothetical protein